MNAFLFNLANLIVAPSLSNLGYEGNLAFLDRLLNAINDILGPVLVVVASVGSIYAVFLGVNLAKADSADKREEAKKRLINAVIALVAMIALILLLRVFADNIDVWIESATGGTE
ncbi:MAG: hypothetical protein WCX32_04660 [Clostridia bacterium]|jgi:heme O synthase-like polyprenyltransferase|nr:hypothetical protein [Clostridia bacterium]